MKNKNQHIGSAFDEFLQEEGILEESHKIATKRVLAHQIESLMKREKLTKSAMAKKMHTSRTSINRLLDPNEKSLTLKTLEAAANVLGKKVHVELV